MTFPASKKDLRGQRSTPNLRIATGAPPPPPVKSPRLLLERDPFGGGNGGSAPSASGGEIHGLGIHTDGRGFGNGFNRGKSGGGGFSKLLSFPWGRDKSKSTYAASLRSPPLPSPTDSMNEFFQPLPSPTPSSSTGFLHNFPRPPNSIPRNDSGGSAHSNRPLPPPPSSPGIEPAPRVTKTPPRQHPSIAMMTPPSSTNSTADRPRLKTAQSFATVSSGSFASTSLFFTTDEGESDGATSQSGATSSSSPPVQRMWRTKPSYTTEPVPPLPSGATDGSLASLQKLDSPLRDDIGRAFMLQSDDDSEAGNSGSPLRSVNSGPARDYPRRNSTPITGSSSSVALAMLLADDDGYPSTPPRAGSSKYRHHRLSASDSPSPTSPPFDPRRTAASSVPTSSSVGSVPSASHKSGKRRSVEVRPEAVEDSEDADDEVSPPRVMARRTQDGSASGRRVSAVYAKGSSGVLVGSGSDLLLASGGVSYDPQTRIPSIRFDGISMDAVFAEVERKMGGANQSAGSNESGGVSKKRRTRVLSMYRPFDSTSSGSTLASTSASQSSLASSASSSSSLRAMLSTPSTSVDSFVESSPSPPPPEPVQRPLPRRISSRRPSPLDVAAANALPVWGELNTPRSVPAIQSPGLVPLPMSPASPTLSSTPSPGTLGDAFIPYPSPALSSTSTLRGSPSPSRSPIPEVFVRPPTPPPVHFASRDPAPPLRRNSESRPPIAVPATSEGTSIKLVSEGRKIKVSSRVSAGPRQMARRGTTMMITPATTSTVNLPTPPLASAASNYATPPVSPPLPAVFVRTPSESSFGSTEDDASDVEDALNSMLLRLAQPHTPPSSPLSHQPHAPIPVQPSIKSESVASEELSQEGNDSGSSDDASLATDSDMDGYDSMDFGEIGVVMMGERVSCGYQIGVAV
ncbi:hypothetical protein T439DRAFT_326600 [Meredithblackwellia eburnea MCA 4105]